MEKNKYIPIIKGAAAFSILMGLLVICGWIFDVELLKRVATSFNSMKLNVAVCFVLLGIATFLKADNARFPAVTTFLLMTVIGIAGLTLIENIARTNLGIDELLVRDVNSSFSVNSVPGRMSPSTSFSFLLISVALFNIASENRKFTRFIQFLLHVTSLISFIILLGYFYDLPSFYKITIHITMAVHSAVALLILSVGISFFHPALGITGIFTGTEIGNTMAKRLFPTVLGVFVVLGYLRLESQKHQWITQEFGIALFASSFLVVCLALIASTAKRLNRIDSIRHEAEEELRKLNKNLEETVATRTLEARRNEEKFFKTFQMNPASMMMSDIVTGEILEINQSFIDSFGYTFKETIGQTALQLGLVAAEDRQRNLKVLTESGYLKNHETSFYTKSRERRIALTSTELIDIDGHSIGLTILHDITERKLIEEKLEEAKRLAEESSVSKERFMANMSHEIRTPMNAIIGFTNLMEKTELDENQQQYLRFIKTSGENLLVLINDILDYSKIEAGMMNLEIIPFRIADLLQSIGIMFAEKAREKKLELNVQVDPSIPLILLGDPTRLTQILINLLGNAIKFTADGEIILDVKLLAISGLSAKVVISVKDTGVGIPADKQKEIFNRFVQASDETTRHYGGTGLGLSIVKSLVEIQEGELSINSEEGKGTEFLVTLTYVVGVEEAEPVVDLQVGSGEIKTFDRTLQVLLVEDNVINQVLAKKVLSRFGCDISLAENGGIAVEMAKSGNYDIILMDIQMPIMDGYTASSEIRKLNIHTPIIAMTAHVMAGEREKCISFGMSDYISKPFKEEALYNLIAKYTQIS